MRAYEIKNLTMLAAVIALGLGCADSPAWSASCDDFIDRDFNQKLNAIKKQIDKNCGPRMQRQQKKAERCRSVPELKSDNKEFNKSCDDLKKQLADVRKDICSGMVKGKQQAEAEMVAKAHQITATSAGSDGRKMLAAGKNILSDSLQKNIQEAVDKSIEKIKKTEEKTRKFMTGKYTKNRRQVYNKARSNPSRADKRRCQSARKAFTTAGWYQKKVPDLAKELQKELKDYKKDIQSKVQDKLDGMAKDLVKDAGRVESVAKKPEAQPEKSKESAQPAASTAKTKGIALEKGSQTPEGKSNEPVVDKPNTAEAKSRVADFAQPKLNPDKDAVKSPEADRPKGRTRVDPYANVPKDDALAKASRSTTSDEKLTDKADKPAATAGSEKALAKADTPPLPAQKENSTPPLPEQKPVSTPPLPEQKTADTPPLPEQKPVNTPPLPEQKVAETPALPEQKPEASAPKKSQAAKPETESPAQNDSQIKQRKVATQTIDPQTGAVKEPSATQKAVASTEKTAQQDRAPASDKPLIEPKPVKTIPIRPDGTPANALAEKTAKPTKALDTITPDKKDLIADNNEKAAAKRAAAAAEKAMAEKAARAEQVAQMHQDYLKKREQELAAKAERANQLAKVHGDYLKKEEAARALAAKDKKYPNSQAFDSYCMALSYCPARHSGDCKAKFCGYFNAWRPNGRRHMGNDWGGSLHGQGAGSPVKNPWGGKVVNSGRAGGYGNQVKIESTLPDGTRIRHSYSHLQNNSIPSSVYSARRNGTIVPPGASIGRVGNTGFSKGAHLHMETELYRSGRWIKVDPSMVFRRWHSGGYGNKAGSAY